MATIELNSRAIKSTAVTVGVVLTVLTVGSYLLGIDHLLGFSRLAMSIILVVAFVKVWLVTQYFMDMRHAPRWLAVLVNSWIVISAAIVIGLYITH